MILDKKRSGARRPKHEVVYADLPLARKASRPPRKMLLRGQITLAFFGLACVVIGLAYFWAGSSAPTENLPHVSANFEKAAELPVLAYAPSAVLERVPPAAAILSNRNAQGRLFEKLSLPELGSNRLQVEYTFDAALAQQVEAILDRAQAEYAHILVSDVKTGRLLAYASTDRTNFPPTRTYPAASLVKVVTTAAAMRHAPDALQRECRYQGSPYRLTPSRVDPPEQGSEISFQRALATSNNQCFAQLAVHAIGAQALIETMRNFGLLAIPAVGHAAGQISLSESGSEANDAESRYELGELGSGLSGLRITPLHALQLAMTISDGMLREPYWIARVSDTEGRELSLPVLQAPARVLSEEEAARLRAMMVETTQAGTARRAFRARSGHTLLDPVRVAGKTGSLSGTNPSGRYEWFIGAAPAEAPSVAVAVVVVQGNVWLRSASQIAAEVLRELFCPRGVCETEAAQRFLASYTETRVAQAPKKIIAPPTPKKRITSEKRGLQPDAGSETGGRLRRPERKILNP